MESNRRRMELYLILLVLIIKQRFEHPFNSFVKWRILVFQNKKPKKWIILVTSTANRFLV